MKKISLIFCWLLCQHIASAQLNRYIIQFKDKGSNPYSLSNPQNYLSDKAISRRVRYHIPIDSSDLPVTPSYVDSIRLAGNVTILNFSKWLNQISIQTNDVDALDKINRLPFVRQTFAIAPRFSSSNLRKKNKFEIVDNTYSQNRMQDISAYNYYGKARGQILIHHADFLHNHGFKGNNMEMAVIDAGFYRFDVLATFDSIRNNHQILGTWDFVDNEFSVSEDDSHGMQCLSTIAANLPGKFVGTAPATSFYLFRTEDANTEYPIEEHNLAAGAERADSLGVDVCSISLGYNTFDNPIFDHTYAELDGNTTMSANAVDWASKKGILMVVAAGNEGNNAWRYIGTPADADSCLAVGAVDTLGRVANFSSYGPSSDRQTKPTVAAVGWNAIIANTFDGSPTNGNGTSFACPNMAGVATCLWQAFPEVNNMEIIETLKSSGNFSDNPNNRIGYGIPDAKKAFVMLQQKYTTTQASLNHCLALFSIRSKVDSTMIIDIERKLPNESEYNTIFSISNNLPFNYHTFTFTDTLGKLKATSISYRYKMNIGTDTSYYMDSVLIAKDECCNADFTTSIQHEIATFETLQKNDSGTVLHFWDFGDGTFSTEKNPVHPFTSCGNFKVIHQITQLDSLDHIICTDTSQSIEYIESDSNFIYPNPVTSMLNINIACPNQGEKMILIQNMLGQIIRYKDTNIDMSGFPKGVYFVIVFINNQKILTKKVMKL